MTAIRQTATVVQDDVREALERMLRAMQNPTGFYKNVGEHLMGSIAQNFQREAGPDGVPWAKLRPATIRARERKGQTPIQILRATRRTGLSSSIHYEAFPDRLEIGTPKEYAAIHQLGGTIERAARKATIHRRRGEDGKFSKFVKASEATDSQEVTIGAYTITMPARPFIGASAEDEKIMIEIATDWLEVGG